VVVVVGVVVVVLCVVVCFGVFSSSLSLVSSAFLIIFCALVFCRVCVRARVCFLTQKNIFKNGS
jgi:hypothetical protein